jgi:molecular chaperone GrpE
VNPIGDLEGLEKNVGQETNSQANSMSTATGAEVTGVEGAQPASLEGEAPPNSAEVSYPEAATSEARERQSTPEAVTSETLASDATSATEALLTEIVGTVREMADASERYHARAQQREGVIDYLQAELDLLRRGERRGLLRPVLADLCRLRDDLLKQAATLPGDFDAAKATDLLRSYAETIQLTLESNGVIAFAPDDGDPFDPRMHRRVSGEATADPALAGRIAEVRRDGYLDIESNSPIAPAEVTVFAAMKGDQ